MGHSYRVKDTATQLFREIKYWDIYIQSQNILGHSYLEVKNTGTKLLQMQNILGHSYLEPKHSGEQLFRAKTFQGTEKEWKTALQKQNILEHIYLEQNILVLSYLEIKNTGTELFSGKKTGTQHLEPKHTGVQLFIAKIYQRTVIQIKKQWETAIQRQNILGHS